MADIILTVDVTSLKDAQNKLQNFGKEVNKFSVVGLSRGINTLQGNIRELFNAQNQGTIGSKAYQLGLKELQKAYQQMGYSSQAATAAVRKYAAELQRQEAARAAAQAAKELARAQQEAAAAAKVLADRQQELRMRFQQGYALFTQQRQAMRDLREAYRANIVTLEQYQARLAQIRAGNLSGHINQQAQGMSRFGVITQQAGYQVGDFFVQVQSGTNVLVAFGQQATQLVGTFAMLATSARAIAIFSGLGVLIAIGTAIGAAMMRASGASKTLKDRLGELSTASSDLKANFDLIENSGVETKFGDLNDEITSLTSSMLALNAAAELNNLIATLDKVKESAEAPWYQKLKAGLSGVVSGQAAGMGEFGGYVANPDTFKQVNEEAFKKFGYSMGRDTFIALTEGMQAEAKAGNREGVIALFDQFVEDATDAGTAVDGITASGSLLANQLYAVNIALAESNALLNGSAAESERLLEAEKARLESILLHNQNLSDQNTLNQERAEAVREIIKSRDDELTSLQQQRSVLETILTYGKDSAEVKTKEAEVARAIYMQEQMKNGILGNNLKLVMDEYDAMAKVKGEVDSAADSAKTFADNLKEAAAAMGALTGLGESIGRALQVATAKVDALKSGAEEAVAGTIAGYYYDIEKKSSEAIAAGNRPDIVNRDAAAQRGVVAQLEAKLNEEAALRAARAEDKKSASKKPKEDPLEKLKEQLALENELIGATEAQERVLRALGEDRSKYSQAEIDAITAEIEAYNTKMEVIKQQKQLMDTVKSSLEDGFMSMVEGTKSVKDAFKDMARDIIKELYRVLVVQKIVNSIAGVVNGFTMPGTSVPAPRDRQASGGSIMGGYPYLVGEQGPELVIPRHSGTVVNANQTANALGGNSGAITVQNNITVTGSDAAMVRAEVAKMIPQITNATKAAVIDAKQRGGQMAAAFR